MAATVIFAFPAASAVTLPLESTIATSVLSEINFAVLYVAFLGFIFTFIVFLRPTTIARKDGFALIDPASLTTLILAVASAPLPSVALTLIVAYPGFLPYICPDLFTETILFLLLDHFNTLFVAELVLSFALSKNDLW